MALRMYTSRDLVPAGMEIVIFHDAYFSVYGIELVDSVLGRKIIEEVEEGKYVDVNAFIGKFNPYTLYSLNLSTGSKMLFNMLDDMNHVKCFDTISCGQNVIQFILDNMDGNIIIRPTTLAEIIDESREYYVNGIRISNDKELTEVLESVKNSRFS